MRIVELQAIAETIDYGHTASSTATPSGPKFLRITDIQNGHVDWDNVPFCQPTDDSSVRLKPGDIVFARTGATTGKSFLVRHCPADSVFASYLIRVRLGSEALPGYIAHFFKTQDYWSQITRSSTGTAQAGVNASNLRRIKVPLPPLPEQRRIAAILDQADALRTKRRQALMKVESLATAMFYELFGASTEKIARWDRLSLAALCARADDIKCGPFGTQLASSEYTTTGVPLWGIKHVNSKFRIATTEYLTPRKAYELKSYSINPGDIVMTRKGTIGNCAIYPTGYRTGVMHSDLLRVRPDASITNTEFLNFQLHHSPEVSRQLSVISGGAVMAGINVSKLKQLEVFLPPLKLQMTFAERLEAVHKLRAAEATTLAKLDAMFASLQNRAFNGLLRPEEWESNRTATLAGAV